MNIKKQKTDNQTKHDHPKVGQDHPQYNETTNYQLPPSHLSFQHLKPLFQVLNTCAGLEPEQKSWKRISLNLHSSIVHMIFQYIYILELCILQFLYERPCTVDVANMLKHVYFISAQKNSNKLRNGFFATLGPNSMKACYVVVKEPKMIET